jgi:hypothetical protein
MLAGKKQGSKLIFGPGFLPAQDMKCTSIYRRWKRDIVSLMVSNRGLCLAENDPNRLFHVCIVSLSNLQEKAA